MNRSTFRSLIVASMVLASASVASAHPGHNHGSGFGAGAYHPFTGIDHILAMIAVGLLAAQFGGRAIWGLPAIFLALMAGGGLMNMSGFRIPLVEQAIMASVLVLGIMVALSGRFPTIALAVVGFFAIFHGYAHLAEMSAGEAPAAYALGFLVATAILHLVGIGIGMTVRRLRSATFLPWSGAGIAVCGVLLFMHVI